MSSCQARLVLRRELDVDLMSNRAGHLALQHQHVGQITLVAFAPQMFIGGGIDQLCRDSYAAA